MVPIIRLAGSFTALVGALALLLADSDSPNCEVVPFDRTYSVESSCPDLGAGTVRIRLDSGPDDNLWAAAAERVDGDALVTDAQLFGECSRDGDPAEYKELTLSLALGPADGGSVTCQVALEEGGSCPFDDPADPTRACEVRIEPVVEPAGGG